MRFTITSGSNEYDNYVGLSEVKFTGTPVPEPGSGLLAALALLGFAVMRRMRK